MSTEIVKQSPTIIRSFDDAERAAQAMAASGFFPDSKQAAQAVVKILAGHELGFGPFASMTGIYIIQGKPTVSANLMAAAIKRSGRYNYRIAELSDTACEIIFLEGRVEIGRSRFTVEDAKRAGLMGKATWQQFPRNLLFARALSNGARWYCPDIFGGGPVYTPEELGAPVNEAGEVVDAPVVELPTEPVPVVEQPAEPPADKPDAQHKNGDARDWPFAVLQAILKAQLSDGTIAAKHALNLSNLTADVTPERAVAWMRVYRAARDEGSSPQDAANRANGA